MRRRDDGRYILSPRWDARVEVAMNVAVAICAIYLLVVCAITGISR